MRVSHQKRTTMKQRSLMTEVKIKKSAASVLTPAYKTVGSAGCDVCSRENIRVWPGKTAAIMTGLYLQVPEGHECQVRSRSGLARDHGVVVAQGVGTIDSDFRGELCVLLLNTTRVPYEVKAGDRIAQLVFAPVTQVTFKDVDELDPSQRGEGGWGSTGVR